MTPDEKRDGLRDEYRRLSRRQIEIMRELAAMDRAEPYHPTVEELSAMVEAKRKELGIVA